MNYISEPHNVVRKKYMCLVVCVSLMIFKTTNEAFINQMILYYFLSPEGVSLFKTSYSTF